MTVSTRSRSVSPRRRKALSDASVKNEEHHEQTVEPSIPITSRENIVVVLNFLQLALSWLLVVAFLLAATFTSVPHSDNHPLVGELQQHDGQYDVSIPPQTLSDFGTYPNPLRISESERRLFHPVVHFPKVWMELNDDTTSQHQSFGFDGLQPRMKRKRVPNYSVLDLTTTSATSMLASEEERQARRRGQDSSSTKHTKKQHDPTTSTTTPREEEYLVGRYDENRVNLYASALFDDTENSIDSYQGVRTVHMGIDLDGPVGTKVFAFADGIVHSAGYNEELGDYGNVIVVEHKVNHGKIYALYGHLDDKSTRNKRKGTPVKRGKMIGRMGDIHENGGWTTPHVHFQLSIHPPDTHDMPGVVSMKDRPRALVEYPDPRYVLGPLY